MDAAKFKVGDEIDFPNAYGTIVKVERDFEVDEWKYLIKTGAGRYMVRHEFQLA